MGPAFSSDQKQGAVEWWGSSCREGAQRALTKKKRKTYLRHACAQLHGGNWLSGTFLLSLFLSDFCLKPFSGNIPYRRAGRQEQNQVFRLGGVAITGLMLEKLSTPLVPFRSARMHPSRSCYSEISCLFNIDVLKVSVL